MVYTSAVKRDVWFGHFTPPESTQTSETLHGKPARPFVLSIRGKKSRQLGKRPMKNLSIYVASLSLTVLFLLMWLQQGLTGASNWWASESVWATAAGGAIFFLLLFRCVTTQPATRTTQLHAVQQTVCLLGAALLTLGAIAWLSASRTVVASDAPTIPPLVQFENSPAPNSSSKQP